jgi:NAD(P)-dependent dehydrogenase (short-subunit alcohol dehydrogenase family)
LAEEGASVAVVDSHAGRAEKAAGDLKDRGGVAIASVADVSDPDAVDQLLNATDEHLGAASILVNAVGISEGQNVFQTDPGQWDRTLAVNVGSYFLCARALGIRLRDQDTPGAIVNISSTNAFYAEPDAIAYTASKGAVEALTKGLALELAPVRIRVNAVCPGIIRTPVTEGMLADSDDAETLLATWNSAHALGRMGAPHEIAAVVAFLASDDASFVTGSSFIADGGLSSGWLF